MPSCVFKPTLKQGLRPILQKRVGGKESKLIYDAGGGKMVANVPVPLAERARFALTDEEILTLAVWVRDRGPLLREARPTHSDGH